MSLLKLSSTQLPIPTLYTFLSSQPIHNFSVSFPHNHHKQHYLHQRITCRRISHVTFGASNEDTQTELNVNTTTQQKEEEEDDDDEFEGDPDPQDLEYISQIKRVLELLKKNRDMLFSEVQDGKIPRDRVALQMLAEEMVQWPNLEVEATKKGPRKSLYAKATDTGIDPEVAAKKLNIDWDSAAEIEEQDRNDESEVPSVVGYGALYLVTAFPVIIGISVVLILFYNSLQ